VVFVDAETSANSGKIRDFLRRAHGLDFVSIAFHSHRKSKSIGKNVWKL
jgi:hypothetical protein